MRFFLVVFCVLISGCVSLLSAKPLIAVSIEPQRGVLKHIGGDLVDILVMVPPGASPAVYEPRPSQVARLEQASAYFAIDVPFERSWMPRLQQMLPALPVVQTWQGVSRREFGAGDHHDHDQDHGHDHDAGGKGQESHRYDPHIWLSPARLAHIGQNMAEFLADLDPQRADQYRENAQVYAEHMRVLEADIRRMLAVLPPERRNFLVFHPSWGYFAADFDLEQVAIEVDGGEPSPRELARLERQIAALDIAQLYVQPQFSQRAARTLAERLDIQVSVADPLSAQPAVSLRDFARQLAGLADE